MASFVTTFGFVTTIFCVIVLVIKFVDGNVPACAYRCDADLNCLPVEPEVNGISCDLTAALNLKIKDKFSETPKVYCANTTCPVNASCVDTDGGGICRCMKGSYLQNNTCAKIGVAFRAKLKLKRIYKKNYTDPNSPEFIDVTREIEPILLNAIKKDLPDVEAIQITKLSKGSTVVTFNMIMKGNGTEKKISTALQNSIKSGSFDVIGSIKDQNVTVVDSKSPEVEDSIGLSYDETLKARQKCLDRHNYLRNLHNMPPMKEDLAITLTAQKWANYMARTKDYKHSAVGSEYRAKGVGENLAVSWGAAADLKNIGIQPVNLWYDEICDYTKDGWNNGVTGHFTSVIWKASTSLGCGFALKEGTIITIAQYSPGGNIGGYYVENVGKADTTLMKENRKKVDCEAYFKIKHHYGK